MIISKDKILRDRIAYFLEEDSKQQFIAECLMNTYMGMDFSNLNSVNEMKEAVYSYLGFDEFEDEPIDFLNDVAKLDYDKYANNEYAKAIKNCGKYKNCSLEYLTYEPYQIFPSDDLEVVDYIEKNKIGYFDKEFKYLALLKNNVIWMSLNPNEIKTMEPYIAKAKGDILVLGLGMGYVAFMMALKSEVKSITIIEKDPNVINIFNNLIWPDFKNKEKIRIINDDAIHYLKAKQSAYDYIFADLWHSPEDGILTFLDIKRINKNIDCWLEVSMYAYLRRCMFALLDEQLRNFKDNNYTKAKIASDEIINKLYFKTKETNLKNIDDLYKILDSKFLLNCLIKD